jgi:RNA polymerase sigma-70 factor, ECF subfamily
MSQPMRKTAVNPDCETREAELVIAAREGSKDAFEELQKLHWARLYKTVFRITKNREDTEDTLQDTFLRAYLALERFEGRSKFSSWLTRIAVNSALMGIRRQRARPQALMKQSSDRDDEAMPFDIRDSRLNPEQTYDQQQRCLRMLHAVERLNPKLHAPIQIRRLQECSIKEIAEILDLSESAARSRLHRARQRLRRSLGLATSTGHFPLHPQKDNRTSI